MRYFLVWGVNGNHARLREGILAAKGRPLIVAGDVFSSRPCFGFKSKYGKHQMDGKILDDMVDIISTGSCWLPGIRDLLLLAGDTANSAGGEKFGERLAEETQKLQNGIGVYKRLKTWYVCPLAVMQMTSEDRRVLKQKMAARDYTWAAYALSGPQNLPVHWKQQGTTFVFKEKGNAQGVVHLLGQNTEAFDPRVENVLRSLVHYTHACIESGGEVNFEDVDVIDRSRLSEVTSQSGDVWVMPEASARRLNFDVPSKKDIESEAQLYGAKHKAGIVAFSTKIQDFISSL